MTALLEKWAYCADAGKTTVVMPDGCRDVIIVRRPQQTVACFLSMLDTVPRRVLIDAGVTMVGYRLRPGARIDLAPVIERIRRADHPADIGGLVEEHAIYPEALREAIDSLSQEVPSVGEAARMLGASQRALERLFRHHKLKPPAFWLRLARARRAARRICADGQLAEIAYLEGYADQAHMTREIRRWFDATPGQLRRDTALRALVAQSGLATPVTGEQISIR